jgi:DNA invertase Pin-like site-specific DNA recombinase
MTKRTRPLALAYTRVSTADQVEEGASLDAQTAALTAEAERRGWDIEFVREEGRSAKSIDGRPALAAALERLNRKEADFLLCVRLDRLSRSVRDFASLVEDARRYGWGIVLQSPNLDLTDPAGEFTANVLASAAQYERRLIGARTREGMAQRKAEGVHVGRRADEAMIPTYRRIISMHAAGQSMNAIAVTLTAEGVPTARGGKWAAATVRRILVSETAKAM